MSNYLYADDLTPQITYSAEKFIAGIDFSAGNVLVSKYWIYVY